MCVGVGGYGVHVCFRHVSGFSKYYISLSRKSGIA